ncbi:MAG: SOS response-associated peptidase [Alcaligenaceae bacterium]|nr:SOS response-associated peptidase [Alcaligenaceae bacterium]
MCGRYALFNTQEWQSQFELDFTDPMPARYNIAPQQIAPVIKEVGGRRVLMHAIWGLRPSWANDAMPKPFNAKVETVAEKPFFRNAWQRSRVIVPANGYYEWKTTASGKQPYFIYPESGPFGFAGLLEFHEEVPNFTIITTAANALTQEIHDRMPVILQSADYAAWLSAGNNNNKLLLRQIAGQYPLEKMRVQMAHKAVGNVSTEGAFLLGDNN